VNWINILLKYIAACMLVGGIFTGLYYLPAVINEDAVIEINGEPTSGLFAKVLVVAFCCRIFLV